MRGLVIVRLWTEDRRAMFVRNLVSWPDLVKEISSARAAGSVFGLEGVVVGVEGPPICKTLAT